MGGVRSAESGPETVDGPKMVKASVYRYAPDVDEAPRFETYEVPSSRSARPWGRNLPGLSSEDDVPAMEGKRSGDGVISAKSCSLLVQEGHSVSVAGEETDRKVDRPLAVSDYAGSAPEGAGAPEHARSWRIVSPLVSGLAFLLLFLVFPLGVSVHYSLKPNSLLPAGSQGAGLANYVYLGVPSAARGLPRCLPAHAPALMLVAPGSARGSRRRLLVLVVFATSLLLEKVLRLRLLM